MAPEMRRTLDAKEPHGTGFNTDMPEELLIRRLYALANDDDIYPANPQPRHWV